ncbi:MAG: biotin/lipoyl-binding protein [bacterium]|nr:biotin/lipoyl-binding protein [bacterium]MCP4800011.1 biotin/lipoyl-binding protein [bacterium]
MWLKKKYILNIAGEQFTTTLARDGDKVALQVEDGELKEIDAEILHGGGALSLRIDGKMHLVDLTSRDAASTVAASVDGKSVDLTVMDELKALALESAGELAGSGTVNAEIPGVVIEISVSEGQEVTEGDPLLILEAMKMQNEISAPITGKVTKVLVAAGDSVATDELLIEIEAAE